MLLKHSRENDEKAVFEKFFQPLCHFSTRIVGNPEDGKDIAIQTLSNVLKRLDASQDIRNIQAFLYISARNACFTLLEKRRQANEAITGYINSEPDNEEVALANAEVLQHLYIEVGKLPGQYKTVCLLMLDGLKTIEIAEQLGWSVKTVKNYKLIAYKKLRLAMLKKGLDAFALLACLFREQN